MSSPTRAPFLAWPRREELRVSLPLILAWLILFAVVYGGASYLTGLHDIRVSVSFDFETRIPFFPWAAAIYLSMTPLLCLAPFVLRGWREITPLFLTVCAETLVAGIVFLLFPVQQSFAAPTATGPWSPVYRLADTLNLDHNEFPSLHVAFAFTAAIVFSRRCGPLGRVLFGIWAMAIAVSTLLIHDHQLLDVLAGIGLAALAVRVVYRKTATSEFLDAWPFPLSLLAGWSWLTDPYAFLDDARARNGLTFRVRLPVLGRCLFTGDPRLVREIVQSPDLDSGRGIRALRDVLGDGSLITLDGPAHRDRRRSLHPPFRGDRLAAYDRLTIRHTLAMVGDLPRERPFSVYTLVRRISLRTIIQVLLGEDVEMSRPESLVDRFLRSFDSPLVLFLRPLHVGHGSLSPWGRAMRNRDRLREYLIEQVGARRRTPGPDALSQIVRASEGESDEALATEVLTLLMFGHDTGAAALAWAFAHLFRHPRAVERVRDEAGGAAGDHRSPTDGQPYLLACLKESMRLSPVVVHLTRVARRDTRIGAYAVRADERVIPCTYLAHHNPEVFEDPDAFRPERFLADNDHRHAYFPFGFGDRRCLGEHFAMRQMTLIASTMIARFALRLAEGYNARPSRRMVLIVPRGGTQMIVRDR